MAQTSPVTLQINVAPVDLPHASAHPAPPDAAVGGSGPGDPVHVRSPPHSPWRTFWGGLDERRTPMRELLEQLCREHPGARIAEVDYTPERMQRLADDFTAGSPIPAKDTKGAPFYPYLFGLHEARNDLVFHLDSDLMFGGASQTWIEEARDAAGRSPQMCSPASPLPGPPTADGSLHRETAPRLRPQLARICLQDAQHAPVPDRSPAPARARAAAAPARADTPDQRRQGSPARQSAVQSSRAVDQ